VASEEVLIAARHFEAAVEEDSATAAADTEVVAVAEDMGRLTALLLGLDPEVVEGLGTVVQTIALQDITPISNRCRREVVEEATVTGTVIRTSGMIGGIAIVMVTVVGKSDHMRVEAATMTRDRDAGIKAATTMRAMW
jgi:hypothetical protein